MSVGYMGKTTNAPRERVAAQAQAEREAQWGEITGTVVSFDPATQTASIQPDYMPRHNGEPVPMPQLEQVPVRFTRAGGFVITSPVRAGDKVTLRPQMRSSEGYHTGGEYVADGDARSFHLSDMEAFLEGGEPLTDPIQGFNSDRMEIRTADGSFRITMSPDGRFELTGANGNLVDLIAQLAELFASHRTVIDTGSSAGTYSHDEAGSAASLAAQIRGMVG